MTCPSNVLIRLGGLAALAIPVAEAQTASDALLDAFQPDQAYVADAALLPNVGFAPNASYGSEAHYTPEAQFAPVAQFAARAAMVVRPTGLPTLPPDPAGWFEHLPETHRHRDRVLSELQAWSRLPDQGLENVLLRATLILDAGSSTGAGAAAEEWDAALRAQAAAGDALRAWRDALRRAIACAGERDAAAAVASREVARCQALAERAHGNAQVLTSRRAQPGPRGSADPAHANAARLAAELGADLAAETARLGQASRLLRSLCRA